MHCTVVVSDSCPTLPDAARVLLGCRVKVGEGVLGRVERARRVFEAAAERRPVYGVSTNVGGLLDTARSYGEEVLVREHAAGVGPYLNPEAAKLVVYVRLYQLSRGHSPVRPAVVKALEALLNSDVAPAIPVYGSVGASGDLAPLAHLAALLMGEGRAFVGGRLVEAWEALERAGVKPLRLETGEALSLINGTAFSTGVGLYALLQLRALVRAWSRVIGEALSLVTFNPEHYLPEAVRIKKHPVPEWLIEALAPAGSAQGGNVGRRLQDPYSLRCTPQVLSAYAFVEEVAARILLCEACSPSDNPVVVGDNVRHQCSFHGIHVGLAVDQLALAMALLANAAERRIAQLLEIEPGGRRFLGDERSPHGMMIAHYTAAALTARLRQLASPHTVHSIPTSGLQEDLVSMSANAALRLLEGLDALKWIAAVEVATLARLAALHGTGLRTVPGDLTEQAKRLGDVPVSALLNAARRLIDRVVEEELRKEAQAVEAEPRCDTV